MDVNPYDQSRIVLKRGDNDYINANLVTVSTRDRRTNIMFNYCNGFIFFSDAQGESKIHFNTRSTAEYCATFLAHGMGAKFESNINAQQDYRKETGKYDNLQTIFGSCSLC